MRRHDAPTRIILNDDELRHWKRLREECGMPVMECPNCNGTGYEEDVFGEDILCSLCEGTGDLFVDEDLGDTLSDAGA